MEDNFLAVNKKYFNLGLKSIDIFILAQIDEFIRNNCECYVTNQQMSDMFGESVRTIARSLDKLESLNFINRNTVIDKSKGQANRVRRLSINYEVIKANVKMSHALEHDSKKLVPDVNEASAKNSKTKCQNGTIKEKKKENKKDKEVKESDRKKYKSQLKDIDMLMDVLDKKGIKYSEEEIIDSYMEVNNRNLLPEYKWNCETLANFINEKNNEFDNTTFSFILNAHNKETTKHFDDMYGSMMWDDD